MKRIMSLTLALALMTALFTGCGCAANVSTHPGGKITESTTEPSIMPMPTATHETHPRETTMPHMTDPTGTGSEATGENSMPADGNGSNGATGESSTPTDTTTGQRGRSRNTAR